MKRAVSVFLLLFMFTCWNAVAQQSDNPDPWQGAINAEAKARPVGALTNESIVKLVRAGLDEGTIIAMVNTRAGNYSLGPDDVIALKQAGLSDEVIAAMAARARRALPDVAGPVSQIPSGSFQLEDGTPLRLRLQQTISSATAQVNDTVDFDVLEQIKIRGMVVIPKGSIAWATVTRAEPKRRLGRGGRLDINIDSVRLADGEKAALRAVRDLRGGGHGTAMTIGAVATTIVVWPAAPLFFLMHGKDITIPKGTEITAYVNGDFPLDPANFIGQEQARHTPAAMFAPSTLQANPQTVAPPTERAPSTVVIRSAPDGADITVDGNYVGSTPSTLKLSPGTHTVSVSKPPYKHWQRAIMVGSGEGINVDATLDK